MYLKALFWVTFLWLGGMFSGGCATTERKAAPSASPAGSIPPKVEREFRGVWIATVDNIDWPTKNNFDPAQQRAELIAMLDRAAKLKLNAIIFQVRPQCDALYASQLEPWSEFLTGQMGKAPGPPWDPLAFVIAEAHKRGMELHAWFNPYRALHPANKGPVSANHISKTKPQLVRTVGRYLWLDPGEPEVQEHSLAVVMDVVKRYDIDGVHFDDYFYPYPEKSADGRELDFPDEASWQKVGVKTRLSRDDWRRENANGFVQRVHQSIKAEKPWVKFGISPFGIWRPGHPAPIKGFDQYGKLYADARKWLMNGWVDYFAPQLYWPIDSPGQSFPLLLDWWNHQNPKKRHIWPGLAISRLGEGWKPEEIVRQVRLTEKQPVSSGQIFFSMKHFARYPALTSALQAGPYAEPALIPAMPWLTAAAPQRPTVTVARGNSTHVTWTASPTDPPKQWVLQYRVGGAWQTEILPGETRTATLRSDAVEAVAVSAVNRAGISSAPALGTIPR
jgi:uncharacterized lipoprotein YddW (UPF0748 family)